MAKAKSVYICQNCGQSQPTWSGQCPSCSQWNTLVETLVEPEPTGRVARSASGGAQKAVRSDSLVSFSQVANEDRTKRPKGRFSTTIGELDRVLGGGLVPGVVILIGGEPGIGKSTLLTQLVVRQLLVDQDTEGEARPILYVSGEESPSQISLRINRILENEQKKYSPKKAHSSGASLFEHLLFVTSTDVDEIASIITQQQPQLVIVDSIQTLITEDLSGAEGSVGQVREVTQRITDVAKRQHVPIFLVGHVTKEGTIAGPKVLEHIVDAVLELSGERNDQMRILRAVKNRFGATDEVGVFRVDEYGLAEVPNPSEWLLENAEKAVPGSATVCVMEGTRPLLIEVQALVVSSQLAMPRRVGRGIELSRIQVLSAVLQKHAGLPLGSADIFVNAAGGFTVREPSVDLGIAVAVASSLKGVSVPEKVLFIGEVGLLGEIRSVSHLERRIKEAKRLGYSKIITRQTHRRVRDVLKELSLI